MKVEHVNISVGDIHEAVEFLQSALPDFKIRGEGDSESDGKSYHWVHIGTADSYVALQGYTGKNKATLHRYSDVGANHIGFEVKNLESLKRKLSQKGYKMTMDNQEHPARRRVYFETSDGLEWEFVEYDQKKIELKNDYELG